jgi:Mce-associated membrane protein
MTTFIKGAVSAMIRDAAEHGENSENATTSEELEPTTDNDASLEEASTDERQTQRNTERESRPIAWSRVLTYGVLPTVALLLGLAAGYLKWVAGSADDLTQARAESVRVAREDAVALLSYKADSVEKDLGAARERLTGEFKDAYTDLTRQVVIPGAKEKHITAVAKVNSAAPVSVTPNHAVALLFVDQTVTIGDGAPTDTQPVIRVTLDKVNGRWLVSHFDPV